MMFVFNFWVAVICGMAAMHEVAYGSGAVAFAYMGFGLGYVGLAWLYLGAL